MSLTYTGRDFVIGAYREIGAIGPTEVPEAADFQWGFQLLNELLDSWQTQQLTTLVQEQHEYTLVSGQGSPDNPYTIGPGGDFDTGTAARPDLIRSANLSLEGSTPAVQIPLAIITDDMEAAIQIKTLQTQLANYLYYRRTVPLGQIEIWPVPNTAVNTLVLFTDLLTPTFATAATTYVCPPAYARAIRKGVAKELCPSLGIPLERAQVIGMAADYALLEVKEANANAKMADLSIDPALTASTNGWGSYNILSDQGS